jgi:hypothetical protein
MTTPFSLRTCARRRAALFVGGWWPLRTNLENDDSRGTAEYVENGILMLFETAYKQCSCNKQELSPSCIHRLCTRSA